MIPASLSATAAHVADHCMRRYTAEYYHRARGAASGPATFGSFVHAVLEEFVQNVFLDGKIENDWSMLEMFLIDHCNTVYGTIDVPQYVEAFEMLKQWYERTDFTGVKVLAVENKMSFDLPTSIGPIPFNYIFDRFDQTGPKEFRVIDYKTLRWGFNPEDLKQKIQARTYALAASIWLKAQGIEYDTLWVEFDLLRHQSVGTKFSRNDNIVTWKRLGQIAEKIIATDENDAPANLNPECIFCSVKTTCPLLQKNILTKGVHSLSQEEQVDVRAKLDFQRKAVASAIEELDDLIIERAKGEDETSFETSSTRLSIVVRRTWTTDPENIEQIVGSELFKLYGGKKLTKEQYNKLLKHPGLSPEKLAQLRSAVGTKVSEPSVKVEPREFTTD